MYNLVTLVLTASISIVLCVSAAVAADDMAVLQESKPLVSRTGAWQTWGDRIHLKSGQETLPLRLVFTNGAGGQPRVTDMNAELQQKPLATMQNFNGGESFSIDLSGRLHAGYNALTVKVFGPSGARLNWRLFIQRPIISSVSPEPFGPKDTIKVRGRNFSTRAQQVKVHLGKKQFHPLNSQEGELSFKLPAHVPGGSQDLLVSVAAVKSSPFKVSVRAQPYIARVSMLAAPPHHPVTLEGSGFSRVASENVVTFRGVKAEVVSASETSITCLIPEMHFPDWHAPIKVVTNGLPNKGKAYINVDSRVIENEGVPMH